MSNNNYGAREFLFLWSEPIKRGWMWPRMLHEWTYHPENDNWMKDRARIKVMREADVSVGILLARGISREHIERTLRETFNDSA